MRAETVSRLAVALGILALAISPAFAQTGQPYTVTTGADGSINVKLGTAGATTLSPAAMKAALTQKLPMIGSSLLQAKMAEHLGLTNIGGKALRKTVAGRAGNVSMGNEIDNLVSGDSIFGNQTEPSIAVNPIDTNIVVVGGHNTDNFSGVSNACSVYISFDGGQTYFYDSDTLLSQPTPFCSDTVVRFSPDGTRLYVTYLDINGTTLDDSGRIEVRNGFNPSVVLSHPFTVSAFAPNLVDKEWLDVHTWDATGLGAAKVYMTFTVFTTTNCDIWEATFSNYGGTVDAINAPLATSNTCGNPPLGARLLQGSRPVGGPGPEVLVCWFDAGTDGWSTGAQTIPPTPPNPVIPLNKFNIACRTSNDRGLTFAGGIQNPEAVPGSWLYAGKGIANEVSYYMGPNANFFRYSGGEFPSLTIDHLGTAHVVVGFNPAATNRFKPEQGNVAYMRAPLKVPSPFIYPTWTKTTPVTGFGAQFFPTVTSQMVWDSAKPNIYIGWLDTSGSSTLGAANANLIYDVRFKKSTTGGATFGAMTKVSEHASLSDFSFIGDYIDSTANQGIYQIVWTDNRFANDIFDPEEHFFSDRY